MARIVFDLDGTLIDSAPDIGGIANRLLARKGLEPITLHQMRDFVGNGPAVFIQRMRHARGIPDAEQDALLAEFMSKYDTAVDLTQPYAGVVDALEQLSASGHRLGICTNKPIKPTMSVVRHLDLERHFGTFVGGDSLPQHKPHPDPLREAFAALGEGREIFVGDSEVDAATAQAAGVPFLLFTEGYRKTPVAEIAHDHAFSHFDTFCDLVERIA